MSGFFQILSGLYHTYDPRSSQLSRRMTVVVAMGGNSLGNCGKRLHIDDLGEFNGSAGFLTSHC
jgi:hypothetical protein